MVIDCLVMFSGWLLGGLLFGCGWLLVILVLVELCLCDLFSLGCCGLRVWWMLVFVVVCLLFGWIG